MDNQTSENDRKVASCVRNNSTKLVVFGWYIQYLFTINDTIVDAAASGGAVDAAARFKVQGSR